MTSGSYYVLKFRCSLLTVFWKISFFINYLYRVCVYLHEFMCTMCVQKPAEARRWCQIPLDGELPAVWVLGTEPWVSASAASALHGWATPQPHVLRNNRTSLSTNLFSMFHFVCNKRSLLWLSCSVRENNSSSKKPEVQTFKCNKKSRDFCLSE